MPPHDRRTVEIPFGYLTRRRGHRLRGPAGGGNEFLLAATDLDPKTARPKPGPTIADRDPVLSLSGRDAQARATWSARSRWVSSASVYCDAVGRTLDEAAETGFPEFDGPIPETNPTVRPGPETYSTRKVAMERLLLDEGRIPVTVLRPCAIHGLHSTHARAWWFIKRALDGRRRVPLAYDGLSRFHTTATANLAEMCRRWLEAGGTRVLNVGDPHPPSVSQIGQMIGNALGCHWEIIALPGEPQGSVGRSPWSVPRPLLIDTTAARTLGFAPVTDDASAVQETCHALREAGERASMDWDRAFPVLG